MTAAKHDLRVPTYPVDAQFIGRWSPRAFAATDMTEAEVLTLIEAARWAPSASNDQPWRFVWALRGDAGFAAVADALVPFNKAWAEKASALIVVASRAVVDRDGAEVANAFHSFDAGTAWGYLAMQAHLGGFVAHAMGGFDHGKTAAAVALPANHVLHAVVAVGHQGDAASLPEMLQAREVPNQRVALDKIAIRGGFAG